MLGVTISDELRVRGRKQLAWRRSFIRIAHHENFQSSYPRSHRVASDCRYLLAWLVGLIVLDFVKSVALSCKTSKRR